MSGSEIGPECVIAAGSVVVEGTKVPPRSVVMGVPGKVVRPATIDEVAKTRAINARYLEMARRYADGSWTDHTRADMPDDVEALAADILGETDRPPAGTGPAASAPPAADDALPLAETVDGVRRSPGRAGTATRSRRPFFGGRRARPVAARTGRATGLPGRAAARGPAARGRARPRAGPTRPLRGPRRPRSARPQSELGVGDQRRLDVDAKQELVAKLLHDTGCEGLLVLHPANFRWLTAGATPAGLAGRDETPALFFNLEPALARRLGDRLPPAVRRRAGRARVPAQGVALDGQPGAVPGRHGVRPQGRQRPAVPGLQADGAFFAHTRRRLSPYEAERLAELGEMVAHAVEATARHFDWGDPEEEIAGHLAHRLLRHGAEPVGLADQRRRPGAGVPPAGVRPEPVERACVLQATARKFGLHATASRTVFRAAPDETERAEFEAALRLRVTHLAVSRSASGCTRPWTPGWRCCGRRRSSTSGGWPRRSA